MPKDTPREQRFAILLIGRNNISGHDFQKSRDGFEAMLKDYMALGQPWWIGSRTEMCGVTTVTLYHADVKGN